MGWVRPFFWKPQKFQVRAFSHGQGSRGLGGAFGRGVRGLANTGVFATFFGCCGGYVLGIWGVDAAGTDEGDGEMVCAGGVTRC